jgi:hypothetical protein
MTKAEKVQASLAERRGYEAGRLDEWGAILNWLRGELPVIPRGAPDEQYRMGQSDGLKLAITGLERFEHRPEAQGIEARKRRRNGEEAA